MALTLRPFGSRFSPPVRANEPAPFVEGGTPSPAPAATDVPESFPRLRVYQSGSTDVVIVDADLGPVIVEHAWPDAADPRVIHRDRCLTPAKGCPLCGEERFGKGRAFRPLTVVDYSAHTAVDPRRVMAVNTRSVLQFLLDHHLVLGTLAGTKLRLTRAAGDTSTLGVPKDVGEIPLTELRGAIPLDWGKVFPRVTAAQLRKRHGIEIPVGSPDDLAAELTKEDGDVE